MQASSLLTAAAVLASTVPAVASPSYYTAKFDDPKAVYVTSASFPVHGDGVADDTAGIQQAIDQVQETDGQGIVFLPTGRYRITKTIQIWPGIRVIGYGPSRPTLVLASNTPGFQDGERFMVFFPGRRPKGGDGEVDAPTFSGRGNVNMNVPNDANPGTFYSAMSNVDIEIGDGNPGAVGVRGRYAQHCYLAHMDFHIGSGFAGIHDTGNIADDLHFYGGQYGIVMRTPSPGWQFTLLDSTFEGQSVAAIKTHDAGLTLIRPEFKQTPTAISIDPTYTEQLWLKDGRMEDIAGPAIIVSGENFHRLQLNMENVACRNVPTFASYRESGKTIAGPGETYVVKAYSQGLHYDDIDRTPETRTAFDAAQVASMPPPVPSDVPALPSMDTWVNVQSVGAKGDGTTDDTAALQAAIATYKTLYFPTGKYLVTETIALKPDTVLVGLNPITTQILIADDTPAFNGIPAAEQPSPYPGAPKGPKQPPFPGSPVPLLETPSGGTNIVTGIGLDAGGDNPAAVGAKWMAGAHSMMDDVKFLGGHGSGVDWNKIYNANHTADGNPNRHWDSQYYSLWITDGGGGTFKNIWTASTYAQAGMAITNTSTPGRVYEMSSEHHVRHEIRLRNVSHWEVCALQTEEERGESGFCLPLEIQNCSDITIANLFMYRVVSSNQPFAHAVTVAASKDIRFRNVHCYSDSKVCFDDTVYDPNHAIDVRQREFAWMTVSGNARRNVNLHHPLLQRGVERLAGGFDNISGGAVDPKTGDFYFVDARWQRIYRWDVADKTLTVVRDSPLSPVNLAFDRSGNLMVVSYTGSGIVYTFNPNADDENVTVLTAQPSINRPNSTPMLPVGRWRLDDDFVSGKPVLKPWQFVSTDGSAYIPAGDDFLKGSLYYGTKMQDLIRAFGLAPATPGKPFYITDESNAQTYVADILPDGTLTNAKLFVNQGGESVTVDGDGHVYLAAGQIEVYTPDAKLIDTIDVPERPTLLAFGGKDGRTLFICARSSLYAVELK